MGCGGTWPVVYAKSYEDWQIDDPQGQDLDAVRTVIDGASSRRRR